MKIFHHDHVRLALISAMLLSLPEMVNADGAPTNWVWNLIWSILCAIPFLNWGCNRCDSVVYANAEAVGFGNGGICRMHWVDPDLNISQVWEARDTDVNGQSGFRCEVIADAMGDAPADPVRVEVKNDLFGVFHWGLSFVTIENPPTPLPSPLNCADIVLGADKAEEYPVPGAEYLPMDDYPCSEFGNTLIWLLIYKGFYE